MKKAVYFLLVSLLVFTSCKKDASNPVNAETVPSPPTLATPKDTSSNIAVPVVLIWNESGGAKSYTLQVSAGSSFSSFVYNKSDITTTSPQIPDLNYLSVYYWRVSASNSAGTSDWSEVWSFTTTGEAALVPQLSLPANGAIDQKLSPVLTWNKVSNASKYTLQISTNSSFTSFVFDSDTLTSTSKQITDLSGLTKYYWRVSAANNFGTKGWSETWSFTTGVAPVPPVLISPSDGAIDVALSTTLTWNASSVATTYTLQVSTSNSFSSFVYNQSGTATNKQITGLTNSTKYYWRVSTTNNYGTSTPSAVWSFTTGAPPAPPTLLTPTDGAINISLSPTLTWNASNGASYYSLQVATDNSFTNMIYNNNVGNITTKQINGLTSSTKYYWNVRVTTDLGTSNPSAIWSFNAEQIGFKIRFNTLNYNSKPYIVKIVTSAKTYSKVTDSTGYAEFVIYDQNNVAYKVYINNGQQDYELNARPSAQLIIKEKTEMDHSFKLVSPPQNLSAYSEYSQIRLQWDNYDTYWVMKGTGTTSTPVDYQQTNYQNYFWDNNVTNGTTYRYQLRTSNNPEDYNMGYGNNSEPLVLKDIQYSNIVSITKQ